MQFKRSFGLGVNERVQLWSNSILIPPLIGSVIWEDHMDTIGAGNWAVSSNSSIAISGDSSIAMTTINSSDASMVKSEEAIGSKRR